MLAFASSKGWVAVTKSELIDEISSNYPGAKRQDIEGMVNAIFDSMALALSRHDRIEIRGLGVFVAKKRKSRTARNPRTGEVVTIPEKFVPFFTAGKELRERINQTLKH